MFLHVTHEIFTKGEMWLDRLSGNHSASAGVPPPQVKSYSPSPRRPIHLGPGAAARPSLSHRSSALYLGSKSNLSTTSVDSARALNGSALKNEIIEPDESSDPLKALEEILGRHIPEQPLEKKTIVGDEGFDRPSYLVEDVDFEGLSLQEFSQLGFLTGYDDDDERELELLTPTAEECEYVYHVL